MQSVAACCCCVVVEQKGWKLEYIKELYLIDKPKNRISRSSKKNDGELNGS